MTSDRQIFNCLQGSDEWIRSRMGIPTASEFAAVMSKEGRGPNGSSKTRTTYMRKLAGEIITGEPMEQYSNAHMERGKEMEAEAIGEYTWDCSMETQSIGFIRYGNTGCSPDLLVGTSGMSQIKTKLPHLQIEVLLEKKLPPEHKAQVQGELWIADREWSDFVSYWPKMPLFVFRVQRDEEYIKQIATDVARFNEELAALVDKVRQHGAA